MKLRMKTGISGMRDGRPWPARGEILETDPREAAELVAQGHAEPVEEADAAPAGPPASPASRRRRRTAETSGEASS